MLKLICIIHHCYGENKCILLPKEEYIKTVGELLEATQAPKKSPRQFYLLKKYELLQCGDIQKLIKRSPFAALVPMRR